MNAWAFNKAENKEARKLIYESLKNGKARFGWSQSDETNLTVKDNWTKFHSKQLFLLQIKPGDWMVYVSTPEWGQCVAVQALSEYQFDAGLNCEWGQDFRHNFDIDIDNIIEFERRDVNVLPNVNLNPRQRYHRIYAIEDLLISLDNLKNKNVTLSKDESKEEYHLKSKTDIHLVELSKLIHQMNKHKNLERFLAKVFRRIPNVVDVIENGFGWGTDYGADLIVTSKSSIANLEFENKIIVQVKSFEGAHKGINAVEQVKMGIEKFDGSSGMVITTAEKTERLESEIQKASEAIGKPIDLLAVEDVSKFVIKHAPDLLFNLN